MSKHMTDGGMRGLRTFQSANHPELGRIPPPFQLRQGCRKGHWYAFHCHMREGLIRIGCRQEVPQ